MSLMKRVLIVCAAMLAVGGVAIGVAKVKQPKTDPEDKTANVRAQIIGGEARNVILFVGDGMDDSVITAARNYWLGVACKRGPRP